MKYYLYLSGDHAPVDCPSIESLNMEIGLAQANGQKIKEIRENHIEN